MEVLISADRIRERLEEVAAEIARVYDGKPVTVVGILNGCLMFVADVIRRIDLPLRVAFITASSYRGSATTPGRLEVRDELLPDLTNRDVLLLDDILDSGKTLTRVVAHLINRGAASVKVGVLLRKTGPTGGPVRAGLRRLRDPGQVRGRLWTRLQRRVPSSAIYWCAAGRRMTTLETGIQSVFYLVPELAPCGDTAAVCARWQRVWHRICFDSRLVFSGTRLV